MGSRKFINQEISMHYLVSVDLNGMTVYLTRSDCAGSNAVDVTDNMLWNDNEEDGDVRSVGKALTVKVETMTLIGKGR
jgi:hypothetical protein